MSETEHPLPAYRLAVRFEKERRAKQTYFRVQDAIAAETLCDLSSFRFELNQEHHVAVLGDPPPAQLDETLRRILLLSGQAVNLSDDVWDVLGQRRAQNVRTGLSWVEKHWRPGRPL